MPINLNHGKIKNRFRVAVFGSARTKKGDPRYKLIYKLAEQIAHEGIDIVTGGGPGLMDAASRGHLKGRKKKKLYTVGLTIHLPREQKDSFHLDIKEDFFGFAPRLDHFVHLSNVVVVAPGGVGTLLEFFYVWQLVQVQFSCTIPIILFGKVWDGLIDWIKASPLKNKFLSENELLPIYQAKTVKEVMAIIKETHTEYQKSGQNVCINLEKYRIH